MSLAADPSPLLGQSLIEAMRAADVRVVASVPDICTSEGLLRPIAAEPGLRLVRVCKEDEGVSICAALAFCGVRSVLLMQQTGLFDSVNALRAVAVDYRNPVCMLVGLLGKEPGVDPRASARYGVRIVVPLLEVLGIDHRVVRTDADLPEAFHALDRAYRDSRPLALLLGSEPR